MSTEEQPDGAYGRETREDLGAEVRPPTARRVALAVGTFLVAGAGFVFTLFFVGQFAGGSGGGFAGGLLGGAGAGGGFGFAVVLSPLIALFVGVIIGRDGGDRGVVDAGLGTALGFLVMFFATLVVAASLGGTGSGGGSILGAGPLLGFVVGVGLTGAGGAAVTRAEGDLVDSVADTSLVESAVFGLGAFLVFAIGYAVTIFLAAQLAPAEGSTGLGSVGFGGVAAALGIGLLVSPLLGLLVGSFVGDDGGEPAESAAGGGLAAGVGVVGMIVVMYGLVMLLEPQGVTAGDFPLGPLVGFVVGTGLTGAGAAYVAARD